MKVLAAMSGGVDSAVAAARAVDAGHEVVGVHLALSRNSGTLRTGSRGCCTIEDSMDAQRVSALLGIKYFVWDFSERFKLDVVDDFYSGTILQSWRKLGRYVQELRRDTGRETRWEWFQWLAERMAERESSAPPVPAHVAHRNWRA